MSSPRLIYKQFAKYLAVGGLLNGLAYSLYLATTLTGASPSVSMSLIYVIMSVTTYTANRSWTFQSDAILSKSALRYFLIQIIGYLTNLTMLVILSRVLGFPHQWVQLLAIFVVGVELFVLNKYYVFRVTKNGVSS